MIEKTYRQQWVERLGTAYRDIRFNAEHLPDGIPMSVRDRLLESIVKLDEAVAEYDKAR